MFEFFSSIAGFIATIIDYLVDFFFNLFLIIEKTLDALVYLVSVVFFLPAYVKTFVLAMISVSVILFVLNKGSN